MSTELEVSLSMWVCEEEKDGMGWWRTGGVLRAGCFTVLEGVPLGGRIGGGGWERV